jgi:hypothetical protein
VIGAFEHLLYSHNLNTYMYVAATPIFVGKKIKISQLMLELVMGEALYNCKVLGICNKRPVIRRKAHIWYSRHWGK